MRRIPHVHTWNGSDAIVYEGASFGAFGATPEFVELVRKMKWAGFEAHPMDSLGDGWLDLCEREWPPSLWYPGWQPD